MLEGTTHSAVLLNTESNVKCVSEKHFWRQYPNVIDCATCAAGVIWFCSLLFNIKIMYYVECALAVDVNNVLGILLPASLTDYLQHGVRKR
jgi:hypothetical protein